MTGIVVTTPPDETGPPRQMPREALDGLWDLELPVKIRFGQATVRLGEACQLVAGSLVELDKMADDPVEILVNDRTIAIGRLSVVEGRLAVEVLALKDAAGERIPQTGQPPGLAEEQGKEASTPNCPSRNPEPTE